MQFAPSFDYFYGGESELFSYYRISRLLVTGKQFRNLSTDAKLLYGPMLDRMGLSMKNQWYDAAGRVFIYYPLEEIMYSLNCGHNKAVRLLAELDASNGIGLIERIKQGQGKPTIIKPSAAPSKRILLHRQRDGQICTVLHDESERKALHGLRDREKKRGVIPLRGIYATGSVPVKAGRLQRQSSTSRPVCGLVGP